jgi:hypothetical protein
MYRTFHRVIAFFVVATFVALSFPTLVQAQKAGDFGPNCETNPEQCDCKVAFRNNDNGNVTVLDGSTNPNNVGNNWVITAKNLDYSYSFFITRPSDDAKKDCRTQQTVSTSVFDWGVAGRETVSACFPDEGSDIGNAVAVLAMPFNCPASPVIGGLSALIDGSIFRGNWMGVSGGGADQFECGWDDDYSGGNGDRNHKKGGGNPGWRISPWRKLSNSFDEDRVSRINMEGNVFSAGKNPFYCGMLVFRRPDDEIIEDVAFELCKQAPEGDQRDKCEACIGNNDDKGIWTAVGCIKALPEDILSAAIRIMLSIAGGVAMLRVLIAGFIFSTSRGNPDRTSKAKEMLTQAVVGLIFLIFSVSILEFIGFTILRIPGFGG